MQKKRIPMRQCVGCREMLPKRELIRVVRSPEGLVTKVTERKFIKDRYPILGIPILRGAVTFISSMITGGTLL